MKSKKIFRYKLNQDGLTEIVMPPGSDVIHVKAMPCGICLWASVPTWEGLVRPGGETRKFLSVRTGDEFGGLLRYCGTVTIDGGLDSMAAPMVYHILES